MPPLVVALAAAAAVVLGAPYVGQLRGAIQDALPGQYRTIVAGAVTTGLVIGIGLAVSRIRDRRASRYLYLAGALAVGTAYAYATRTGNVDQDVVERFHFVEYGLVTYLFHRAWRGRPDASALALPLAAGILVGVADELFQWFIPLRVGEFRDVMINAVASLCGVLFSAGVYPPASFRVPRDRRARRQLAAAAASAVLAAAVFADVVHLGHEITGTATGEFRSRFSPAGLRAASIDRAERWRIAAPVTAPGIGREDHYLSEGQWHVERRNEAAQEADAWSAWHENLILEAFFAPVLDLGARWPAEQREAFAAAASGDPRQYVSDAAPYPIYVVSRWAFWLVVGSLVAGLAIALVGRAPGLSQPARV